MPTTGEIITTALITIVIIVFIFILIREIICWYFKYSKMVDIQEEILQELKSQTRLLRKKNQTDLDQVQQKENLSEKPAVYYEPASEINQSFNPAKFR